MGTTSRDDPTASPPLDGPPGEATLSAGVNRSLWVTRHHLPLGGTFDLSGAEDPRVLLFSGSRCRLGRADQRLGAWADIRPGLVNLVPARTASGWAWTGRPALLVVTLREPWFAALTAQHLGLQPAAVDLVPAFQSLDPFTWLFLQGLAFCLEAGHAEPLTLDMGAVGLACHLLHRHNRRPLPTGCASDGSASIAEYVDDPLFLDLRLDDLARAVGLPVDRLRTSFAAADPVALDEVLQAPLVRRAFARQAHVLETSPEDLARTRLALRLTLGMDPNMARAQ